MKRFARGFWLVLLIGCAAPSGPASVDPPLPLPEFRLGTEQTHNKFSREIPAVLTVPPGAVVEVWTKEATDGQLAPDSTADVLGRLDMDLIHPLTGPIRVEGADPGDVLAVTLHEIEAGEWAWNAIVPGFGLLADEFPEPYLKNYRLDSGSIRFAPGIEIPLRPFAGVMGVAPDTEERLSTIPPRANGGNMDNPYLTAGTTVYFPVLVEGALFSIGDSHAVQGLGEVCGTAAEAPMRFVLELNLIEGGRTIREPEYETDEFYAVTAFATTLDEAVRKVTRFMIDYLVAERGMNRTDAYALCSLAGDLHIAEVVDVPNVHVSMHIPKSIFID